MAPDGGYIAGPSQKLPFREENLAAMNEAICKYGRINYSRDP
jgi:hypothetical protein